MALLAGGSADAAPLVFTVDAPQSSVSISAQASVDLGGPPLLLAGESQLGNVAGVSGGVLADGSTSDGTRTTVQGQMFVELTATEIRFRSPITALNPDPSGLWSPGPGGGAASSAQAALWMSDGASADSLTIALRDALFTHFSGWIPLVPDAAGDSSFDASLVSLQPTVGAVDYTETYLGTSGHRLLWSVAAANSATMGRLEVGPGTLLTLRLPIDVLIQLDPSYFSQPITATLHLTGELVATHGVPEPALLWLLSAGLALALFAQARRRSRAEGLLRALTVFLLAAACGRVEDFPARDPLEIHQTGASAEISIDGAKQTASLVVPGETIVSAAAGPGSDVVKVTTGNEAPAPPGSDVEETADVSVELTDEGSATPLGAVVEGTAEIEFAPGSEPLALVRLLVRTTNGFPIWGAAFDVACGAGGAQANLSSATPPTGSIPANQTFVTVAVNPSGEICIVSYEIEASSDRAGFHRVVVSFLPSDVNDNGPTPNYCSNPAEDKIGAAAECQDGNPLDADVFADPCDSNDDCQLGVCGSNNECAGAPGSLCMLDLDCPLFAPCDRDGVCRELSCGQSQGTCEQPECLGSPLCPGVESSCTDGLDNDSNGQADCQDSQCSTDPNCQANRPPIGTGITAQFPFLPYTTRFDALAGDPEGGPLAFDWYGPNCGRFGTDPEAVSGIPGLPDGALPNVYYWWHPNGDSPLCPHGAQNNHPEVTTCVDITDDHGNTITCWHPGADATTDSLSGCAETLPPDIHCGTHP